MGFIGNVVDSITGGKKAGKAAVKGAETTAKGIEEAAKISADAEWGAREAERGGEVQARDYRCSKTRWIGQGPRALSPA